MENNNINQEEFNQFFREIIEKYKNNVRIVCNTCYRYEIFDENGDWLFVIDYKPKYSWLSYSYNRIFPLFKEKFGINEQEFRELMKPVEEQDFKLMGITSTIDRICGRL